MAENKQKLNPAGYVITKKPFNVNPFFDMDTGGSTPEGLERRVADNEDAIEELQEKDAQYEKQITENTRIGTAADDKAEEAKTLAEEAKGTAAQALQETSENRSLIDSKQDKLKAGTNITIDENNVISATGGGSGGSVVVDSALSTTSTNPVQNKVITEKVNQITAAADGQKNMIDTNTSNIQKLERNMTDYVLETVYNADHEDITNKVNEVEKKIPVNYIGIGSDTDNGVNDRTDVEFSTYTDSTTGNKTIRANLKTSDEPTSGCKHPIQSDAVYQMNTNIQLNKQNRLVSPQGSITITPQSNTRAAIEINPDFIPDYTAGDGIHIMDDVISVESDTMPTYGSNKPITSDAVYNALQDKQNTLTAGDGIVINDNVISATGGGSGGITVDSGLSETSENPVQNKVITSEIFNIKSSIDDTNDNVSKASSVFLSESSDTEWLKITKKNSSVPGVPNSVILKPLRIDTSSDLVSTFTKNTSSIALVHYPTVPSVSLRLRINKVPTENSTQPVQSGGVYDALQKKADFFYVGNGIKFVGTSLVLDTDYFLSNDYVSSNAAWTSKKTAEEINAMGETKQDKLIAGTGISIVGNEIMATGETTGSPTIFITSNTDSGIVVDHEPGSYTWDLALAQGPKQTRSEKWNLKCSRSGNKTTLAWDTKPNYQCDGFALIIITATNAVEGNEQRQQIMRPVYIEYHRVYDILSNSDVGTTSSFAITHNINITYNTLSAVLLKSY